MSPESSRIEQVGHKASEHSVSKFLDDAIHNPIVDIGIGVAVGVAVMAGRNKIITAGEELFPSASALLGDGQLGAKSIFSSGQLRSAAEKVEQDLLSRDRRELWSTFTQTKSPAVLDKLAGHLDPYILESVAGNSATAPDTFLKILNNKNATSAVEEAVARNPNASPLALSRLAQVHPDAVAKNPSASAETLDVISKLDNFWYGRAIAVHPNTSAETLTSLASSKDPYILKGVGMHPNTPLKTLEGLPYQWMSKSVGEYLTPANFHRLVASPTTSKSTLELIADDKWPVKGLLPHHIKQAIETRH